MPASLVPARLMAPSSTAASDSGSGDGSGTTRRGGAGSVSTVDSDAIGELARGRRGALRRLRFFGPFTSTATSTSGFAT
jgi:hypothetical protein